MRRWLERRLGQFRSHPELSTTAVKVQVLSDLHLEHLSATDAAYLSFHIPVQAPYLLLAGDIGRFSQTTAYTNFLLHHASRFTKVLLVPGNHEFYGSSTTRTETLDQFYQLQQQHDLLRDNVIVLERCRIDLSPDVTVLGCTLHSYIPPESEMIVATKVKDFQRIPGWTVQTHNQAHHEDVAWLRTTLAQIAAQEPQRRVLVATHHAPTFHGTSDPKFADNPWNSAFATEILGGEARSWEGLDLIKTWVFGHTHFSVDFLHWHIRLYANQRGYVFHAPPDVSTGGKGLRRHQFDPGAVITI